MTEAVKKRIAAINSGIIPEGYKKTKVGIVPVEWDRFKLSEISEELTEKVGNRQLETLSISAGIGFVNQANKFGKELSGKQYEKYTVLHNGDFSYNKGNSKKYPQGCIYRLKDRECAAVPNVFESFRLNKGISEYYEQLFVSGFLNGQLFAKINHGVRDDGLLNLKGEDFYNCYVPFPPLPEQQKIAEILSTQDKLIELHEKKVEKLKELKKAYLQKMFPQKGSKYPEIRFKGFTDAWEQRKLFELSEKVCVGFVGTCEKYYTDESGIPMYRTGNLNGLSLNQDDMKYVTREFHEKNKKSQLKKGDILIARHGDSGKAVIYELSEEANCLNIVIIRPDVKKCDYKFMANSINSPAVSNHIKSLSAGSTQAVINTSEIEKLVLEIPCSIQEQEKIADYFSNLDNLITLHQRKSEQEKQKKKALMQLLLTGKVRCI